MFGPKAGQWQFELNVGQGQFFNDMNGLYYLLPDEDGSAIGLGIDSKELEVNAGLGNNYISGDIATLALNTGSLNYNVPNLSLKTKYFITDHININFGLGYLANVQPSKNYVEGETYSIDELNVQGYDVSDIKNRVAVGDIYSQKAILGTATHRLFVQLGSEYYFHVSNPRIYPYAGVFGQFKMARIGSFYPYTGQIIDSDIYDSSIAYDLKYEEVDLYRSGRVGQLLGFVGGINCGVEYVLAEGFFLGMEVVPFAYQYSLLHMQVMGQDAYYAMNHNFRAFAFPQFTFGFRF